MTSIAFPSIQQGFNGVGSFSPAGFNTGSVGSWFGRGSMAMPTFSAIPGGNYNRSIPQRAPWYAPLQNMYNRLPQGYRHALSGMGRGMGQAVDTMVNFVKEHPYQAAAMGVGIPALTAMCPYCGGAGMAAMAGGLAQAFNR